jgi:hypothetical protein
MVVGIARIEYRIPHARSLKAKRHTLRKLLDRVRARYKVAVNEVDFLDKWQRTAIGVAVLGADGAHVERLLSQILRFMEDQHLAEAVSHRRELIHFGAEPDWMSPSVPGAPAFEGADGLPDRDPQEGFHGLGDRDGSGDRDGLDALGAAARRARPFGEEDDG